MTWEKRGHVLIGVAPNGARRTKTDHPALPMTPQEIAEEAEGCRQAGAGLLHMHVRDDEGRHSLDAGRYREAMAGVRARSGEGLILQITTEAGGVYGREVQMGVVRELLPEACSCALRELCPGPNEEADYGRFLGLCGEAGVAVQHILYDVHDVMRFIALRRAGVILEPQPFALLVVGSYSGGPEGAPGLAKRLAALADAEVAAAHWAACAFGAEETRVLLAAAERGGHVRVGFENSLVNADGSRAQSNAERVGRLVAALGAQDQMPLEAHAARAALGMPPRPSA